MTEQIEDACIYFVVLAVVIIISMTLLADKSLFAQAMLLLGSMTGTVMLVKQWRDN